MKIEIEKLDLWLDFLDAKTELELEQIRAKGDTDINLIIDTYRRINPSRNFKEVERLRSKARHDEAQALHHAQEIERKKWQDVVAEKEAELAKKEALIAELMKRLDEGK